MSATVRKVRCPSCRRVIAIKSQRVVKSLTCPACQHMFPLRIDGPSEQAVEERPRASSSSSQPAIGDEKFAAFISYRHAPDDQRWAKWVQSAIETYRLPKALRRERGLPARVGKVFRDEDELPTSGSLNEQIENNLRASRFLIVICSPRTPVSLWVAREIEFFRELGRDDRILSLLIEGTPDESFPKPLRISRSRQVDADGQVKEVIREVEPLAADVRPRSDLTPRQQRRREKLRLIAPLIGCGFDDLVRRDEQRRRQEVRRLTAIAAAVLMLLSAGIGFGLYQRRLAQDEKTNRLRAEQTIESQTATVTAADVAIGRVASQDAVQQERSRREAVSGAPERLNDAVPNWQPADDAHSRAVASERDETLAALPVLTLEQCLMAMAGDAFANRQVPDPWPEQFVLRGTLAAVQVAGNETWVYLKPRDMTAIEDLGHIVPRGPTGAPLIVQSLPYVVAVIFNQPDFALLVADFRTGEELDIACQRRDWSQFQSGPVRAGPPPPGEEESRATLPEELLARLPEFRLTAPTLAQRLMAGPGVAPPSLLERPCSFVGWCLEGKGLEKTNQPATWIGSGAGRDGVLANQNAVSRSLSMLWRDPSSMQGTSGVVVGKFHSVRHVDAAGQRIQILTATLATATGEIPLVARMGTFASETEFLDYSSGVAVEIHLTFCPSFAAMLPQRFDVPDSSRLFRTQQYEQMSQMFTQQLMGHLVDPRLPPPIDPMSGVGIAWADGHWVQQVDKPSTLVLAEGPRRNLIDPREIEATPEKVAISAEQFVDQPVEWSGRLENVSSRYGETHILVSNGANAVAPVFEAFVADADFVDELQDFRAHAERIGEDNVVVNGTVCLPDSANVRLEASAPLIKITAVTVPDRQGVRAEPGQKRPSIDRGVNDALSESAWLFRKWPVPGTQVTFEGLYMFFSDSGDMVRVVVPSVEGELNGDNLDFHIVGADSAMFEDYETQDRVILEAIIPHATAEESSEDLGWSLFRISRSANPRSAIEAVVGRQHPPLDFSIEKDRWNDMRSELEEHRGETVQGAGVIERVAINGEQCLIEIRDLFFGHGEIDFRVAVLMNSGDRLRAIQPDDEVLFEFRADGGTYTMPQVTLLWVAPIGAPDDRIEFVVSDPQ